METPESSRKTPMQFLEVFEIYVRGWIKKYPGGVRFIIQETTSLPGSSFAPEYIQAIQNELKGAEEEFQNLVTLAAEQIIEILLSEKPLAERETEIKIFVSLMADRIRLCTGSQSIAEEFQAALTAKLGFLLMQYFPNPAIDKISAGTRQAVREEAVEIEIQLPDEVAPDEIEVAFERLIVR